MGFVNVLVNIVLVVVHIILFKLALFLVVPGLLMATGLMGEEWRWGVAPPEVRNIRIVFYGMMAVGVAVGLGNLGWIIWRIRRMDRRRTA